MAYGGIPAGEVSEERKKHGALLAGVGAVSALLVVFAFAASHLSQVKPDSGVMVHATNLLEIPALTGAVRKQSLLETSLSQDKMAQVMPLKYLIEREVVDHGLHAGTISDTELALADERKKSGDSWHSGGDHNSHHARSDARSQDSSCSPFC